MNDRFGCSVSALGDVNCLNGAIICNSATPGALGTFGVSLAPGEFLVQPDLPILIARSLLYYQFFEISPIPASSNALRLLFMP